MASNNAALAGSSVDRALFPSAGISTLESSIAEFGRRLRSISISTKLRSHVLDLVPLGRVRMEPLTPSSCRFVLRDRVDLNDAASLDAPLEVAADFKFDIHLAVEDGSKPACLLRGGGDRELMPLARAPQAGAWLGTADADRDGTQLDRFPRMLLGGQRWGHEWMRTFAPTRTSNVSSR